MVCFFKEEKEKSKSIKRSGNKVRINKKEDSQKDCKKMISSAPSS